MARRAHHHSVAPIGWRPRITFGDRLRMVRRQYSQSTGQPMGQRQMADAVGWGVKAYESYEEGRHVPGDVWAFCLAVSGVTGCDPTWLAGDELPPPPPDGGTHVQGVWHNAWNATERDSCASVADVVPLASRRAA